jgi:hypothetical protein
MCLTMWAERIMFLFPREQTAVYYDAKCTGRIFLFYMRTRRGEKLQSTMGRPHNTKVVHAHRKVIKKIAPHRISNSYASWAKD